MAKSIAILALVLAAAAGAGYYWLQTQFLRPGPATQAVRVDVEPGSSVRSVFAGLHERGALVAPRPIELYLRLHGRQIKIKAGTYEISAGASAARCPNRTVGVRPQDGLAWLLRRRSDRPA